MEKTHALYKCDSSVNQHSVKSSSAPSTCVSDVHQLPVLSCETEVFNVSKWNPKFKETIDKLLEEFPKIGNDVRYDPSIIRGLGIEYDVQWLDKPIPYRAGSFRLSPTDQQNMAKILNLV